MTPQLPPAKEIIIEAKPAGTECPECRRTAILARKMGVFAIVLVLFWVCAMARPYGFERLGEALRTALLWLILLLMFVVPVVTAVASGLWKAGVFLLYLFGDAQKLDRFFGHGPIASSEVPPGNA